MRFRHKKNKPKTLLIISDLHLSGGYFINGRRNPLEDFHFDKELVEFLSYYSTAEYEDEEVELVINGDFLDFLAVPFVNYFDDEYWSESASIAKLNSIVAAHEEVFEAINNFLNQKNKKIVYIIGNHDAEFVNPNLRTKFISLLWEENRSNFSFWNQESEYIPHPEVSIRHGHEYEVAHAFSLENSLIRSQSGELHFLPPWGSYYVLRVVNKYKEERSFINSIRPIRSFMIYGLIFDTLFTLRFALSNAYYAIMVVFLYHFRKSGLVKGVQKTLEQLELFQDYDNYIRDYFQKNHQCKVLIMGHTHEAAYTTYPGGRVFINTGTWTKMFNLDFAKKQDGVKLTYAQIELEDGLDSVALNMWKGNNELPYDDFH